MTRETLRQGARQLGELLLHLFGLERLLELSRWATDRIVGADPHLAPYGLAEAGAQFREGACRFLEEYLGSEHQVVPFGGREAELAELRGWVEDPEAPVRGLLTAPAGRGKSALVARFAAEMAGRKDVELLFLPVSIRFETNEAGEFWQALASGLAGIAGGRAPAEASTGALRGFAREQLERLARKREDRRLPIVVDGLDEAAGWILPADIVAERSRRLRFLVAARELAATHAAGDWLARLGWRSDTTRLFALPALRDEAVGGLLRDTARGIRRLTESWPVRWDTRRAAELLEGFLAHHLAERPEDARASELRKQVRSLLARAQDGEVKRDLDLLAAELRQLVERVRRVADVLDQLATCEVVLTQLARVGEGEPLLLRFQVEMLLDRLLAGGDARSATATLEGLEPGYHGVFRRWLEEEEKRTRQRGDQWHAQRVGCLLAILARAEGPLRFGDLAELQRLARRSQEALAVEAFEPLRRFVVGDANRGYVLQHPKIATYLREEHFLDPRFRRAATDAFARWFGEVLDGLGDGSRQPAAVPPYLLRHGAAHLEGRPELWPRLVADGWRRAHLAAGRGEAGFVRAVERVYELACAEPASGTLGLRLRCALVLASSRARGRNVPDELLVAAAQAGLIGPEEAELIALQRSSLATRADTLCRLAGIQRFPARDRRRFLEDALRTARRLENEWERARVLEAVAPHLPEDVLDGVRAISQEWLRAEVLVALAPHLPEEVLAAAREMRDAGGRAPRFWRRWRRTCRKRCWTRRPRSSGKRRAPRSWGR